MTVNTTIVGKFCLEMFHAKASSILPMGGMLPIFNWSHNREEKIHLEARHFL